MPALSAGKISFFPEGSHECEAESKSDFSAFFCYRSAAHQVGQWRERTQLQLSALIQFTASLGEIITALKPVSTVQRGSRTKAPILSFKYSPRVSGMLWRGRGTLELSHYVWRSVYTTPPPRHVCLTCTLTQVSQRPTGE